MRARNAPAGTHGAVAGRAALLVAALGATLAAGLGEGASARAQRHDAAPPAVTDATSTLALDGGGDATLHVFRVELARATVTIADVGMSTDLEAPRAAAGASLVVNGGFFSTAFAPEGVARTGGRDVSALSRALGGGVLAVTRGTARLFDAETVAPRQLAGAPFAIQCRPRLVVDGRANVRTDDGRRADRTALCVREGGRALDVVVARSEDPLGGGGPTLYALARTLVARGCEAALNLDGGPSTGVAWLDAAGPHALPPRAPVRHAVVFRLR